MPVMPYIMVGPAGSDQADEWMRMGAAAQAAGNLPLAQQHYNNALRLDPRHALAAQNLAIVFAQSNLLNEALLTIERAAMCDGIHGVIQVNWALMAMDSDRLDEALRCARRACELAPNDVNAMMCLAMILPSAGHPDEAVAVYNRVLDREPKNAVAGINACFVQTLTNCGPEALRRQRGRWHDAHAPANNPAPHRNDRDPDRPLRVGYVGGDFKCHSAAFIFGRVVLHHTAAVETYIYSSLPVNPEQDERTRAFKDAAGDRWRDVSAVSSDEEVEAMVRRDRIDVLVDLAAHTGGGRLGLFLRRAAPVQVTAWGFAHGTGCPEVDAFLADPVAVPECERQHYAEKVVDLPCIVTYDCPPPEQFKNGSASPIRRNGHPTLGCFTRYEKLSDECLAAFAEIMRRVPDARLEFKDHAFRRPFAIRRVLAAMPSVEPHRLLFSLQTSWADHMLSYQQCDLFLNPWPHSSGVVTCECLYMGVPMVTLRGNQAAGRSASSVLHAMGREQWVARTPEEYVDKAVQIIEDPKLADVRPKLRAELVDSPVIKGYVEAVEARYRELWRQWCEK